MRASSIAFTLLLSLALPRAVAAQTACDGSGLARARYCAGPWQYPRFASPCYAMRESSACTLVGYGTKQVPIFPTCRREEHGLERLTREAFEYGTTGHKETERICDPERRPPCRNVTTCVVADCDDSAAGVFERHVPPAYRGQARFRAEELSTNRTTCRRRCSLTVDNYPVFNERESSSCGAPIGTRTVEDRNSPKYSACRAPAHGAAPRGECGVEPRAERYSRAGLTIDQLAGADDLAVTSPPPLCLTCDDLPLQSAVDAQKKFDCLAGRLRNIAQSAPGLDRAALKTVLAEKLKLLYELRAADLSAPARDEIVALYRDLPDTMPACASATSLPDVPEACSGGITARNLLRYCARLTLPHVPREVAALGLGACAAVGESISGLPTGRCPKSELARAYLAISEDLLARHLVRLGRAPGDVTPPSLEELRPQIDTLATWYRVAAKLAPSVDGYDLVAASSRTVGRIWSSAHAAGEALAGVPRDRIAEAALETDRRLLLAALESTSPSAGSRLSGVPLVVALSEGFRALAERARAVTSAHDLGCLVAGCTRGSRPSAAGQLWAAWGALSNPEAMQKAAAAATLVAAPWREVFQLASQRTRDIQQAIAAVAPGGRVIDLATTDRRGLSGPLLPLAELIQEGSARSAMEWRTGMLAETDVDALRLGLQEAKHEAIKQMFAERRSQLGLFVRDYLAHESGYLANLAVELRGQAEASVVGARLRSRMEDYDVLSGDLLGLRQSALLEEIRFGTYADALRDATQLAEDAGSRMTRVQIQLPVSAQQARFFSADQSLDTLVVQHQGSDWSLDVHAGDLVHIRTSGAWSPTCALQRAGGVAVGGGRRVPIVASGALVGPEGFTLQVSGSSYSATANRLTSRDESFVGENQSGRVCAGASLTAGGFFAEAFGVHVYASAEACASADQGRRSTSSQDTEASKGVDSREAAQFTTGLRVPGTPFPSLPAGALVAVFRPKTGAARAYVVPSPVLALLAPAEGRVQLVVNDAQCSPADGRELMLDIIHMEPAGTVAKRVGPVMASVLASLRAERERLLDQGRILPEELAAMRERAHQALRVGAQTSEPLPPALSGLFAAWLESTLSMLQRDVEIQAVDRARRRLELELEAARDELASAEGTQRLGARQTRTSLRNLDTERLSRSYDSVVDVGRDYLLPVLELRYPKTLGRLRDPSRVEAFRALVATDPMRSAVEVARDVEAATATIMEQWEATKLEEHDQPPELPVVALSFPHPDRKTGSDWASVDPERAKRLWAQLARPDAEYVTLDVRPEDLYARGGPARLQCSEVVPVIRSMAVYLAVDEAAADTLNIQNWRLVGRIDPRLTFTTARGPRVFQLLNEDWLSDQMRVLFGPPDFAPDVFTKFGKALRVGQGLSPFARFLVDVAPLRRSSRAPNPLDIATELIVIFEVERQSVAPPGARGVAACAPATPSPEPLAGGTTDATLRVVRPSFRVLPGGH